MKNASTLPVPFHGATLYLVERNGEPYVPMKPVVEGMGLAWQTQHRKMAANAGRWGITEMVMPSAGGEQAASCLPLRKLPGWLMSIHPGKVKPEIREKVVTYQNECDDALWDYWTKGAAVRRPYAANPGDTLTAEEADTLRGMLVDAADRLPKSRQGAFMKEGWSKLKSHFKTSYRQIPRSEFIEAVSIVARHAVSVGELLDAEPAAIPGFRAPEWERVAPVGRSGGEGTRTIEASKRLVADLKAWATAQAFAFEVKHGLLNALDDLNNLLISGWTEVDEALICFSQGMRYLHRWQGRSGRVGNVM